MIVPALVNPPCHGDSTAEQPPDSRAVEGQKGVRKLFKPSKKVPDSFFLSARKLLRRTSLAGQDDPP
jgi:hypothetical protein